MPEIILNIFNNLPDSAALVFSRAILNKGEMTFSSVEVRSIRDGRNQVYVLKAYDSQKVRVVSDNATVARRTKSKKKEMNWITEVHVTNYKA